MSLPDDLENSVAKFLYGPEVKDLCDSAKLLTESDHELSVRLSEIERVRYAYHDRVPEVMHKAAAKLGKHISRNVPLAEGRIEMLRYLREQSLSVDYHRYGNTGEREV